MDCINCGNSKWTKKYSNLQKCSQCGLVTANAKYFKTDIKKLYTKKYFSGWDYKDYTLERTALQKNFEDRLKRITRLKKSGKLLEIGCAYGYFLNIAKKHFKVEGIDIDKETTKLARKNSSAKIYTGDFLKKKLPESNYDVICMFDTIEHLKEPDQYIKKAHKLLKPGGIIVIETGDISAFLSKIQGKKWRLINPPFHLYYFSKKSLSTLLTNLNFKIIENTRTIAFYRTLGQTLFRLKLNKIVGAGLMSSLGNYTFPTYTFDLLLVIAKKSSRKV